MSDGIVGKAKFRCSKCGEFYEEEVTSFEVTGGSSRQMGDENEYTAIISEECHNCDSSYEVEMKVWEYPIGIINYTSEKSSGVAELEADYELYDTPAHDSSRVMGAAAGGAIFGASIGGPFGAIIGGILGGLIGDSVAKGDKNG
ncbi:Glycine zipper domain-containing protein [Vibrio crassostreae]|nr:Glycine zipper domain-containing protein [Vibrio crassostreae]CAK3646195.1 Glycine zipper domain-containing protein [Vibrio crassostreae]